MGEVTKDAAAKINLFLHVKGKRQDGYHLLESLVIFCQLGDRITVRPADELTITVQGPFAAALESEENIVGVAARKLLARSRQLANVEITLEKTLPVGAGIGGGSADAAATLRALKQFYNLQISNTELSEIALQLGADVPACLHSKPAIMTGIGEELRFLDNLPPFALLLANPGYHVETAAVFRALDLAACPLRTPLDVRFSDYRSLMSRMAKTGNDLVAPAIKIAPNIAEMLKEVSAGDINGMSGSGATCFSIFPTLKDAEMAAQDLQSRYPDWWVAATAIRL